jgi:hypothetical protein
MQVVKRMQVRLTTHTRGSQSGAGEESNSSETHFEGGGVD